MKISNETWRSLREAIKDVRVAYEQYFMGIEAREPHKLRDQVQKQLQHFQTMSKLNTADRYQLQMLQASWTTWRTQWDRIARQIEEGTYKRDKSKVTGKIRVDEKLVPTTPATANEVGAKQAPVASDHVAARLHADLAQAYQTLGLGTGPALAQVAATVEKQTRALKEQYQGRQVDFKVAVKDGKPVIKAVLH